MVIVQPRPQGLLALRHLFNAISKIVKVLIDFGDEVGHCNDILYHHSSIVHSFGFLFGLVLIRFYQRFIYCFNFTFMIVFKLYVFNRVEIKL